MQPVKFTLAIKKQVKQIKQTLSEYRTQRGFYVTAATIIGKGISFLITVAIIRILSTGEYGQVTYAIAIISFLMPFSGFGANQSLLRFGARTNRLTEKRKLFLYSIKQGSLVTIPLLILIWLAIPILDEKLEESGIFLFLLSFQLLTFFTFEVLKSYYRILNRNRAFSYTEISYAIILFVLAIAGALLFGALGYALSLVIAPVLTYLLWSLPRKNLHFKGMSVRYELTSKEYWTYGINVGFGNIASQLLYAIDIIYIANLIGDEVMVAQYRAASIIPINLLFIPLSFITTDFVKLARHSEDVKYLRSFSKRFFQLFIGISIVLSLLLLMSSKFLIWFLYGAEYEPAYPVMNVFAIGLIGAYMLRIPYGNILSAIGKAHWNTRLALFILALNLILNYYMVNEYGMVGAAITTASLIWLSGIIAYLLFRNHLNNISIRQHSQAEKR